MSSSVLCTPRSFAAGGGGAFVSGLELIPDATAGLVRIADLPSLCDAWDKTTLGKIADEPVMQPLIDATLGENGTVWEKVGDKVGIRPKDLYELGSGEVVAAWIAFETDRRSPSALCVIGDIRGNKAEADKALERIDQDLKADSATRSDVTRNGQVVRVYTPKTRPGQLKIDQVVITLDENRVIAADRDAVVFEILDAIAAGGRENSLAKDDTFQLVMKRSHDRVKAESPKAIVEWFVRPLPLGRIIRDVAKVDRGNKVKVLNLLENQGFDAVQAAGGVVVVNEGDFDLLHRGYVHAPPVTGQPDRYRLAARMLQLPNSQMGDLPKWVPAETASVTRINWRLEKAFWAAETLVDEAFNDKIFRPSIEGIRDDEEGPQIDLERNVMPNLAEHLLLLTDNTLPATVDSERILVAVELKNAAPIREAVRKAMEVEPDVTPIDSVEGVQIWQVQHGGESDELDDEFFDDLGFDEEVEEKQAPLLESWAIGVVPQGKGSEAAYLVFASHTEFLVDVAQRMMTGQGENLAAVPEVKELLATTKKVGAAQVAIQRIVRLRQSLRAKYELQRNGELKDSDSVLASLIRRLIDQEEPEDELERPNAAKWPPFNQVEKYFRNATSFVETTDTGWNLNGFLLH